jgi:hypothetical protein
MQVLKQSDRNAAVFPGGGLRTKNPFFFFFFAPLKKLRKKKEKKRKK